MSGVDTVRGIGYQNAHGVLTALEVLRDPDLATLMVEGTEDILDIEVHSVGGNLIHAKQVKIRDSKYTWGREELLAVFRRWAALRPQSDSTFEFLTDGRLGPTGEDIRTALTSAAHGDVAAIAAELGVPTSDPICAIMGRAQIRQEPTGIDAALQDAEREVRTMLAGQFLPADLEDAAREAVNRLFTLLFITAGSYDLSRRLVTRTQIADTLGGIDRLAVTDRWSGALRNEYLSAAADLAVDAVEAHLISADVAITVPTSVAENTPPSGEYSLNDILDRLPALIAGPTGSGKTTAATSLLRVGAATERVVVLAHAETYSTARVPGLAADALAAILKRDFSSATGQQVVNDSNVILIIDGVSEVPEDIRAALRKELASPVSAARGASIVLIGRDIAKLKSTLPSSAVPSSFRVSGFSHGNRREVTQRALDRAALDTNHRTSESAHRLASQVEHALGDAAGNPMLFTMALELLEAGAEFTDRAALYAATIERLAQRGGATDIDLSVAVLGGVFAALLDKGKRFANPYEWTRQLNDTAAGLQAQGFDITALDVQQAAERSGLIVPIGFSQTRAPLHDSYADYLAGLAHARGQAPLPTYASSDDEQRLLFTAEIGGVSDDLANITAARLPFLTVRMSEHDRRPLGEEGPSSASHLFRQMAPAHEARNISLHRTGDRVIATLSTTDPVWLEAAPPFGGPTPVLILEPDTGPLGIAVRMWRSVIRSSRPAQRWLEPSQFAYPDTAAESLLEHSIAVAERIQQLVDDIAPAAGKDDLAATIGHVGMTALVHQDKTAGQGHGWPVEYRATESSSAQVVPPGHTNHPLYGASSAEYLLRASPDATAFMRLSTAINTLTRPNWV